MVKALLVFLAAAVVIGGVVSLFGGGSTDEPSRSTATGSASEPAAPSAPATSSTPTPDLPNIALQGDGTTPLTCAEWPQLDPDIRQGMAVNALIRSEVIPATPALARRVAARATSECAGGLPEEVAYVVVLRAVQLET